MGKVAERVTVRPAYAIVAAIIFAIEIFIALSMHDGFIRSYVGDGLAVMLIYCVLRALTRVGMVAAIVATLALASVLETTQLFDLLDVVGLRGNAIAETLLGGSFELLDLVAYAAGALITVAAETSIKPKATP